MPEITLSPLDRLLSCADNALRTVSLVSHPRRHLQTVHTPSTQDTVALTESQRRLSASLMRVNHVGEICAQALYQAQALTARHPELQRQLAQAAQDETDHLAWTHQRLQELDDRPSLLTPLWYAGAFGIGCAAGLAGDAVSLGFVAETEHQVEAHLQDHLERLPAEDARSRAIVEQMRQDEARHAEEALQAGGISLPPPVRGLMRMAGKVMTTTAHHI
jgi:3-demethoxyubiquinol 3-hydroxylase